jgi:OFA family oxalate/formate antiporter-like MFS transporter
MVLASMTTTYTGFVVGFGLLAGAGIGCGYASATPPAVKWFPGARTGLIAGIVVSGFGLASVYAAPLAKGMISLFDSVSGPGRGVPWTMFTLGLAFLIVVVGLAQLLSSPPKGYLPAGTLKPAAGPAAKKEEFAPTEMLATGQFYLLWFMYFCGAGAGLMVIGKLADLAKEQAGLDPGFLLVAALAVGNGAGRIVAGTLSDKIGRQPTMFACFVMQAVLMVLLSMARAETPLASVAVLAAVSALIGANYGANLALFPSITKDYYGLKNFGVNYGLVFTAWGIGGFLLSLLAGKLKDWYSNYHYACYTAAVLLVLAAVVTFAVRPPHAARHAAE